VSRITFAAMTAVAAGVAFAFLLLPLLAIFLRVPLGDLVDQFGNQVFRPCTIWGHEGAIRRSPEIEGPSVVGCRTGHGRNCTGSV